MLKMLHMYDAHDITLGKDIFRGLVFMLSINYFLQ